jgi:hypothetical protein
MLKKTNTYNGNPNIKADGIQQNFTPEEVAEYTRCMTDIEYFCKKYVKVVQLGKGLVPFELRGYQSDLCKQLTNERFSIVLAPRQSGKCFHINTIVTVRNKTTGKIENITIGELYERSKGALRSNSQ